MKELLLEIFNEAKDGSIVIDDESFNISFNTSIDGVMKYNGNNDLLLNIRNLDEFVSKVEEYVNKENEFKRHSMEFFDERLNNKFLIAYLFVNCSTDDFMEPTRYVEKRIKALEDKTLSNYNDGVVVPMNGIFDKDVLRVQNVQQSVFMETPYKLMMSISSEDRIGLEFNLPEISYMIVEENGKKVCYVYSILNKESTMGFDVEEEKYKKQISRKLYKLNKGISDIESDEFKEYKNGNSDYYPENITDVSVSSVLSLYVFMNIIKDKVDVVKAVPYLPIRYLSREISADKMTNEEKKNMFKERNKSIQTNLTDKFIRTFRRVEQHLDFLNIDSYPYEVDSYLTCSLDSKKENIVTNEVTSSIKM